MIISRNPLCLTRKGYTGKFLMKVLKINNEELYYSVFNEKNEIISAFKLSDYMLQILINYETKDICINYNEIYKLWKNYLSVIFKDPYQHDLENNSLKY